MEYSGPVSSRVWSFNNGLDSGIRAHEWCGRSGYADKAPTFPKNLTENTLICIENIFISILGVELEFLERKGPK